MISRLVQLQTVKTLTRHNSSLHVALRPLPIITTLNHNTNLNRLHLIQTQSASMAEKSNPKSMAEKPNPKEDKSKYQKRKNNRIQR